MKAIVLLSLLALSLAEITAPRAYGQATSTETWTGAGSTFNTAGDWSGALVPNSAVLCVLNGNSANRTITISGFRSHCNGLRFDASPNGFTFVASSTATASELAPRGSGVTSGSTGNDIVNNSGQTVSFNCPVRFYSFAAGTLNASDIVYVKANSGNIGFNTGAFFAGLANNALGANGGTLDFLAAGGTSITVGSASTPGVIWAGGAGSGGVIKDGAGTLILAGTAANTYGGAGTAFTTLNAGALSLQKAGALGAGNKLTLNGGTLQVNGSAQTIGNLIVGGNSIVDLGNAAASLLFANSSASAWTSGTLDIENWTGTGSTQIRFGLDATGLSTSQLGQIELNDNVGTIGSVGLDANGYLVLVPEPSTLALGLLGGLGLLLKRIRRS